MYDIKFAQFYDNLFTDEKYEKEIELFRLFFRGNRCLDLGCGTGRHISLISRLFTEVYGLDTSIEMLSLCEERVTKQKLKNVILIDSFSHIDAGIKFDTIISLFNVVNHILNYEELVEFFSNTFKYLNNEGVFIFDCWSSAALIDFEERFIRQHLLSDSLHCTEESHFNFKNFINTIDYTVEILFDGRVTNKSTFKLMQKIWTFEELNSALNDAKILKYKLYDRNNMEPLNRNFNSAKRLVYIVNN